LVAQARSHLDELSGAYALRALVERVQGVAHHVAGRQAQARECLTRAIELELQGGDEVAAANAEIVLFAPLYDLGNDDEAERAVPILEAAHERHYAAWAHQYLGMVLADRGRIEEASSELMQALRSAREIGAQRCMASVQGVRAAVALEEGRVRSAAELAAEAV